MSEDTHKEEEIQDPKAVLEALERAKKEAKKFREERDALQERVTSLESDDAVGQWRGRAIKAEAKEQLRKQGVSDVDKVLKYTNLEALSYDDEGNLTGLDEGIKSVKTDFPELFDAKRRVGGTADLFAKGEPKENFDGTRAQVARLFSNS